MSATKSRLYRQMRRLYETAAIVELATKAANAFSGDEEGVDIVEALVVPLDALEGARNALIDIASELEKLDNEQAQQSVTPA